MKATPALAIGDFRVLRAAAALRNSFACLWVHRMPHRSTPPLIVVPDGTIDLQWIDGTFRVAGPDKEPQIEKVAAGATVIGLRFRPAAAAAWLGVPASDMVGQRLPLADLWGAKARRLADDVNLISSASGLIGAVETVIAQASGDRRPPDGAMAAAYELIRAGPPQGTSLLPWLARGLGLSERTMRRRFGESYGYGPKTLDRILRYQHFLELNRDAKGSPAVLAMEAGYSDQAHLIRESRRLTGSTPGRERRNATVQTGSKG